MNFKFKTKILLIFVTLVLVSSMLNMGVAAYAIQKNLTTDLIERIVVSTKGEILDITNFVLTGNKGGVISLIFNQKASNADLAYQLVLSSKGELLASTLVNQSSDTILTANTLPKDTKQKVELIWAFGQPVYDIAMPLGYGQGTLRAGYYKEKIDASVRSILYQLAFGGLLALLVAVIFGTLFARALFRPLEDLKGAVQKIAEGDLSARANITGSDEMGFLATAINEMTSTLEVSQHVLEKKVIERTAELATKLDELERLNKFMINRELKMVELKKEIAALQLQLKK